jgi:hypothetical protein
MSSELELLRQQVVELMSRFLNLERSLLKLRPGISSLRLRISRIEELEKNRAAVENARHDVEIAELNAKRHQ